MDASAAPLCDRLLRLFQGESMAVSTHWILFLSLTPARELHPPAPAQGSKARIPALEQREEDNKTTAPTTTTTSGEEYC